VDPDHYHLLDTEIRRWERTSRTNWGELRSLRDNRGACCFRHDVLPDAVPVIKHYKDAMAKIRDFCGHPITAFFFRDWWSFSGKREYDLSELREKLIAEYLPRAGAEPRVRENFSDDDLRIREDVDREELCLSEMNDITNDGLLQLKRFGQLKRLWLDDMDGITGEGIDALCALSELEWLAICSRSTAFQAKHLYVLGKLPKLKTLFVDGKLLRKKGVRNELSTRLPNVTICER
jgi:hypothetical protein